MTRSRASGAALLTVLAFSFEASLAQELIEPRVLDGAQPPQPVNAAGQPVEGFVTLRYSVLADGTPTNVRVTEVMPPSIDTTATLETFSQWQFMPGLRDDTPIDWHNNEINVVFRSQGGASPTADEFAEAYVEVGELLEAGDLDASLAASRSLIAENVSMLSELGLALAQQGMIQMERDDLHGALDALQMATDPTLPMLNGTELYAAVIQRMTVEQELSRLREAIESHQRLARGYGPSAEADFIQLGTVWRELWQDNPLVAVYGRIDDGSWQFEAGRRFFFIDDIEGRITTISAECDTRRISLEFDPNVDYQLPDTFGDCTLFVQGDDGTTFTLIEALPPTEG